MAATPAEPGPARRPRGLASEGVGNTLTVASGLAFLLVGMLLPLVGRAGAQTAYADRNAAVFVVALLGTGALSAAALASKLARRRIDGSPPPYASGALCGLCLLLLAAFLLGGLRV